MLRDLGKSTRAGWLVKQFSLPAGITCPGAGACRAGCYAATGRYLFPAVTRALAVALAASRLPDFTDRMSDAVTRAERQAARRGDRLAVRIHSSGDFYSADYARAWATVARRHPDVLFYAYTKSVQLLSAAGIDWTDNVRLTYSEGGRRDDLIPAGARRARVYESAAALAADGALDAMADDLVTALAPDGALVGLIYHGASAKRWTTAG